MQCCPVSSIFSNSRLGSELVLAILKTKFNIKDKGFYCCFLSSEESSEGNSLNNAPEMLWKLAVEISVHLPGDFLEGDFISLIPLKEISFEVIIIF